MPVVLRGRAGTTKHRDRDDDDREAGGQPEDAVVAGVVRSSAGRRRPVRYRRRNPACPTAPTSPSPSGPRAAPRAGSRCRSGRARYDAACSTRASDQQGQRRCGGREHRTHQHDGEHDQQHALLAVQVGEAADQRRGRGGGEQVRGDRPADRDVDASSWWAMMPSTGTTAVCRTATVRTTTDRLTISMPRVAERPIARRGAASVRSRPLPRSDR